MGDGGEAKFWLRPEVSVADSQGLNARTLLHLSSVVDQRRTQIEREWHDYFA